MKVKSVLLMLKLLMRVTKTGFNRMTQCWTFSLCDPESIGLIWIYKPVYNQLLGFIHFYGLSLGLWGLKFKIDGYKHTLSDKSFVTSRHDKNENK